MAVENQGREIALHDPRACPPQLCPHFALPSASVLRAMSSSPPPTTPAPPRSLTAAELAHFRTEGYVIVRGAIPDGDFAPLVDDLRTLVERQTRAWGQAGLVPGALVDELLLLPFATRLARVVAAMRAHAEATGGDAPSVVNEEVQRFGLSLDTMYARTQGTFDFFFGTALLDCIESLVGGEILLSPIQHLRPYLPAVRTGEAAEAAEAAEAVEAAAPKQHGAGAASLAPWHQDMGVTREEADGWVDVG